jgi:hypothetical protein
MKEENVRIIRSYDILIGSDFQAVCSKEADCPDPDHIG